MIGSFRRQVAELAARRDLLYMITWREITVKYKQSIMGLLWAVFMPLVVIGSGLVVRFAFARLSGVPLDRADIAKVVVKSVPWSFFVAALRFGTNSLVTNAHLVTKIYMPRLIFPVAAVASQGLDFLVSSGVVLVVLALVGVGVSVHLLWVPALLALLAVLATSFVVLLCALSLFFRDVKYLVEVILTFAIFFTPVFYEASLMGRWESLVLLNPVAPILESLGRVVVDHQAPSLPWLAYSACFSGALLLLSVTAFGRLEPLFAEKV